jgi:hypothetical protein
MPHRFALLAALAALAAAAPVHAQQCDVFTDVQASDSFCASVQWLKNRAVTTGCTQTEYCPGNAVTRAQMALFMDRLGRSQTPTQVTASTGAATLPAINDSGAFAQLCITQTLPAANFPRRARIRGYVSVTATGTAPLNMFLMHDDNPPGPWVNANGVALTVPAPNGYLSLSWASDVVTIAAGVPYRFAIGLALPGGASGQVSGGPYQCFVDVLVMNDNGSSPPFDP